MPNKEALLKKKNILLPKRTCVFPCFREDNLRADVFWLCCKFNALRDNLTGETACQLMDEADVIKFRSS